MSVLNLKNNEYKKLYSIGQHNIFIIIADKVYDRDKDLLARNFKHQLLAVKNYIQTKIQFQLVTIKVIKGYMFAVGRFQITNSSKDQARKIIAELQSFGFQQRESNKIKTRNMLNVTTQCSFY